MSSSSDVQVKAEEASEVGGRKEEGRKEGRKGTSERTGDRLDRILRVMTRFGAGIPAKDP